MNYQNFQNLMHLTSWDTKRTLMHLFLFTNSPQRELVLICTQSIHNCNWLFLHYNLDWREVVFDILCQFINKVWVKKAFTWLTLYTACGLPYLYHIKTWNMKSPVSLKVNHTLEISRLVTIVSIQPYSVTHKNVD